MQTQWIYSYYRPIQLSSFYRRLNRTENMHPPPDNLQWLHTKVRTRNHQNVELTPMISLALIVVPSVLVCAFVIFRRWPGLLTGIATGLIAAITIFAILTNVRETKLVYE